MGKYVVRIAGLLCLLPHSVFAAGAYVVDDADIVDPGKVQVESWFSHGSNRDNLGVADVAYQALPHTEITIENGYDSNAGNGVDILSAQAKYQWHPDDAHGFAGSAVFGMDRSLTNGSSLFYAYVPSSLSFGDVLDINADLGWEYDSNAGTNFVTWGVGTELHADEHWSLVSEVFGKNNELPGEQIGPRYSFSDDLQFDAVYGRNISGVPANWMTFGVTATF